MLFTLVMAFILNISVTETYACSCIQPGIAIEELNSSAIVFSGKVVDIKDENEDADIQSSADLLAIKFQVNESWKGVEETEVTVFTPRDSASCGFNFTLNEEYLVYAHEGEGSYHVNICSRTAPLASASADLVDLGKGEKPTIVIQHEEQDHKQEEVVEGDSGGNNFLIISIAVFGIVIVGIGIALWFFKKRV